MEMPGRRGSLETSWSAEVQTSALEGGTRSAALQTSRSWTWETINNENEKLF